MIDLGMFAPVRWEITPQHTPEVPLPGIYYGNVYESEKPQILSPVDTRHEANGLAAINERVWGLRRIGMIRIRVKGAQHG